MTPAVGAFFTSRDVPLFVWTVNDSAAAQRFATLGVVGIITDVPAMLRAELSAS